MAGYVPNENEKTPEELLKLLEFYKGQHPYDTTTEEIKLLKEAMIYLLMFHLGYR